jgi:excisionase family DNA binding protein
MIKLLAATPQVLAKIDAVLSGTDGRPDKADVDARLITYTEAGRRFNLSRPTIYKLVRSGRLEAVPLDGVNRIRLQSVINFANGATR